MPEVKIKVGAVADTSLTAVFRPLLDAASRARKTVERESQATSRAVSTSMKTGTTAAERAYKELANEVENEGRTMFTAPGRAAQEFGQNARRSFDATKQSFTELAKETERGLARMAKAKPPTIGGFINGQMQAGSTTRNMIGAGRAVLGFGARVAGDVARGAGIDIDFGSQAAKQVDLQKRMIDITNSGYMPGAAGQNGVRQDPKALEAELAKTATETGFGVNQAAEGMQAFVSKTGDLSTGRAVFKDLAVLSKATGTNLEDMVDAAGDVSNNLGDIPNKAERIQQVMRAIAGQGKLGAVEIRDLAAQMAKVASGARMISGDPGKNIGILGALAQESRARGGSASATQAATSVTSFMNTFSKGARLNALKSFGVDVHDTNGLLRDPREIIKAALLAASSQKNGGMAKFNENMGDMFKDVRARSVTRGFESIFTQAGGGEAGIAAVNAEMERLTNSAMGAGEVLTSFNRAMESTESKTNQFNNQLQAASGKLEEELLPAVVALIPAVLSAAKTVGDFTVSVANFLRNKFGVGDDAANADSQGKATDALKEANEISKKAKAGTLTDADVQHAEQAKRDLQTQIANKWNDVNEAKKNAKPSFWEGVMATAFDQSPVGRLANKIGGKKAGQDFIDRGNGQVGLEESRLSNLENASQRLDTVLKVHVVRDSTQTPVKPQQPPMPVSAQ